MTEIRNISGYHKPYVLAAKIPIPVYLSLGLCHRPGIGCFDTVHPCLISSRQNQKQRLESYLLEILCNGSTTDTGLADPNKGDETDAKTVMIV
jgi:hypothetical protein